MKRAAFFLILLLLWAQVDDAWVLAPVSPAAPLADDDEYLPAQRQRGVETSASHQRLVFVVWNAPNGDFSSPVSGKKPSGSLFTAPLSDSSLYVFMSLQC
jgi:hypothetical protein